jgi:gliding motility-associated-like protein
VNSSTNSPVFSASVTPTECLEGVSRDNGSIRVNGAAANNRFILVKGTSVTGSSSYSDAIGIPAGGIVSNTLQNPAEDQSYVLRIIEPGGCAHDTLLTLKKEICDNALFVPQAFTPDGDGKNDLFVINGLPSGGNNSFQVFNRWGSKVYGKSNYDNTWDGRPNVSGASGDRLPQGTYYYILEFKGTDLKPMTGFIVIQY